MKIFSFIEILEETFLFKTSRLFFFVLVMVAMLAMIGGAGYLIWGVSPTPKVKVVRQPDPAPVQVLNNDIAAAIAASANKNNAQSQNVSSTTETRPQEQESDSPDKLLFNSLVDSLRVLLPNQYYPWKSQGHNEGHYYNYHFVTTYYGIEPRLNNFLEKLGKENYVEYNRAFTQLIAVLKSYPENERLEPFKAFIKVYESEYNNYQVKIVNNEEEYNARRAKAESIFETKLAEKALGRYRGIITIGGSIAAMAFLGIFLVLLSMQRGINRLQGERKK